MLASLDIQTLIGPIMNVGAVGIMLIILGIWYVKKDKKYEERIDQRIAAEQAFRKEQSDQQEKYRTAMDQFGKTLDAVLQLMPRRNM